MLEESSRPPSPAVAIRVRGLRKSFAGRTVLDGIELDVRSGETLVILGGSGSGKSTLLRCLVGLERPDEGSVSIENVDLLDGDPRALDRLRRRIGMAFQGGALFGSMTVAENIELPLREFTDLPPETRRIMARIKLGMVGLEDAMDRLPSQLSGGMIKRSALARALAMDPDIVLFDEPSAGLDPITSAEIDRLVLQDIFTGLVKAVAFAVIIGLVGCHQGLRVEGGAEQVGRATTTSVVRSIVLVIAADLFVTAIFFLRG